MISCFSVDGFFIKKRIQEVIRECGGGGGRGDEGAEGTMVNVDTGTRTGPGKRSMTPWHPGPTGCFGCGFREPGVRGVACFLCSRVQPEQKNRHRIG